MICVVGAGVSGLLTTSFIDDAEVVVYEALPRAAYREHCAGIVSLNTCRALGARNLVDAVYSRAVIDLNGVVARVECSKPFAVHIDRLGLEKELFDRVIDLGHRVVFKSTVISARALAGKIVLKVASRGAVQSIECQKIVVAEGFSCRIARSLGLESVREELVGVQALVTLQRRIEEDTLKIVFREIVAPKGFLWVAPLDSGRSALVGIVSRPVVPKPRELLLCIARVMGLEVREVRKVFGGHVFAGYPKRVVRRDGLAVGIGDCVAMVKSVSGGGLYAISRAAPVIARIVEGKRCSENPLNDLRKELRRGYVLYRLIHSVAKLMQPARQRIEVSIHLSELNYDNHVEALLAMMKTFGTESMKIRWSSEDRER